MTESSDSRPAPPPGPVPPPDTGHGPEPPAAGVNLATLMLLIAVLSVCLALTARVALLGSLLSVLAGIALVRTVWIFRRRRHQSQPMSRSEQVGTFLRTLVGVAALTLSGPIAFVVVCFPLGAAALDAKDPDAAQRAWYFGGLAGLLATAVAFLIVRVSLGRRDRPRR